MIGIPKVEYKTGFRLYTNYEDAGSLTHEVQTDLICGFLWGCVVLVISKKVTWSLLAGGLFVVAVRNVRTWQTSGSLAL